MKTKNILLGIFSLLTFATYAQNEKNEKEEIEIAVTELKVKTENLDELINFDWDMLREMFKENDTEQEITVAFAYVNKSEVDTSKVRVDNFEMKWTGKTSDLDKLAETMKKSFDKLEEIDGRTIKN